MSKVFTDETRCLGCNKCVLVCPTHANDAKFEEYKNKIYVNENRCIDCGECVGICDHEARNYTDDTERFFHDLAAGAEISLVVAPAAKVNFKRLERLFGYLKKKGVKLIYDVSFGADICTWGYLNAIRKNNLKTIIAQPCPVIVNYIECFKPELIQYLSPVQSPALCTAIYLNQYKGSKDQIAFLSPCIAKSYEFSDPASGGYIHYNVTYKKLEEYMENEKVDLSLYESVPFDNMEGNYGFTFSRPGGLKENVHFYLGDEAWVLQVEGIKEVKHYLEEYEKEARRGMKVPLIVDALNCAHGCNLGTGTRRSGTRNAIDSLTNERKTRVDQEKAHELFQYFDRTLKLEDFTRGYRNKNSEVIKLNDQKIEQVFKELGKDTEEKRRINCFCCGYGSCKEFAKAIANGHNHKDNCVHYLETALAGNLKTIDSQFQVLSGDLSQMNAKLGEIIKTSKSLKSISTQTKIISINASIESAHAGSTGRGFAVVASEIKRLAEASSEVIERNTDDTATMIKEIDKIDQSLEKIRVELHRQLHSL